MSSNFPTIKNKNKNKKGERKINMESYLIDGGIKFRFWNIVF